MNAALMLAVVALLASGRVAPGPRANSRSGFAADSRLPAAAAAVIARAFNAAAIAVVPGQDKNAADQKPKQTRHKTTPPKRGGSAMEEKFELTEKPQEAVFLASYGWTGGMGEAVLDPQTWTIRFFKDLPIFVDSEVVRKLAKEKLPDHWSGNLGVRIAAKIELRKKTERNPSIPGAPKKTFWEVQIVDLREASLHAE
jgi:hypothetical protein